MNTSEPSNAESPIAERLRSKRIPLLRDNAYGCVVRVRSSEDVAAELAACVKDLADAPMFNVFMDFRDNIELDTTGRSRPCPDDFDNDADYNVAVDAVHEEFERLLPWCKIQDDLEVKLRSLLSWCINDKSYLYKNVSGEIEELDVTFDPELSLWTARDPSQLQIFKRLEQEHEIAINEIVRDVTRLFTDCQPAMYDAEHLLLNDDVHGWVCFFDCALAIVSSKHVVLLWAGQDSWYG